MRLNVFKIALTNCTMIQSSDPYEIVEMSVTLIFSFIIGYGGGGSGKHVFGYKAGGRADID